VSATEQQQRHGHAEPLGRHLIDAQLDFRDLLHRQSHRLFALQDATRVDSCVPPGIMKVRAIAHQAAARDGLAPAVSCRHRSPRREGHDLFAVGEKETVSAYKQRIHRC
jgi:hypothetical protein